MKAMKFIIIESGYSRLIQILSGNVPKILTIGIITAENPKDTETSAEENKERNKKLRKHLDAGFYSYFQIKGKFEEWENPFFIHNITKGALVSLGQEYQQSAVIFGERKEREDGSMGMEFSYIQSETGKTESTRSVFTTMTAPSDFYSEYKGRKFVYPVL